MEPTTTTALAEDIAGLVWDASGMFWETGEVEDAVGQFFEDWFAADDDAHMWEPDVRAETLQILNDWTKDLLA